VLSPKASSRSRSWALQGPPTWITLREDLQAHWGTGSYNPKPTHERYGSNTHKTTF